MKLKVIPLTALVLAQFSALHSEALAQATAFTYQGRLAENGTAASGLHDFEFRLFTTLSGAVQVGSTLLANDLAVSNGLFTTSLDFGAAVFPGTERFLQIAVRPGVSSGAYTNLTPRQPITATPYAVRAIEANTVASGGITTTMLANQSVTGTKIADGTIGRDDVNIGSLGSAFWILGGNSGTDVNTANIGTTDNVPFSLLVNSERALRLEPTAGAPNLIGGHPANLASNGVIGGVISGGGEAIRPNTVGANFATVLGGSGNSASGHSSVAGGNLSESSGANAVAIGSSAKATSLAATAFGSGTTASGAAATALGNSTVAGGFFSLAAGDSSTANGNFATALGRRAKANHDGTFTWADSQIADFNSTAANQFNIRAAGGVGIGTGNPQAPLHVYSGNNPTALRLQSTGGFGSARLEFYSDPQGTGSEWRPAYIQSTDNGGFTGGLSFHVNGTGFDQRVGDLEVMRLVNGRVGIGIANPSATLHVAGDVIAASFAGPEINVGTLSCASLLQYNQSTQEGDHTFTGPTRQMLKLDSSSGFLGVPGLGLQPDNLYFRSSGSFSWFTGGSHSDTKFDPGANFIFAGSEAMRLSDGLLSVYGVAGERAYLGGDGAGSDVQLGSLSVGVDTVALWNAGSGQQMDLVARSAGFSGNVSFGSQTRQMLNLWGGSGQYGIGVQSSTLYFRCNAGGTSEGFRWYKGGTHGDGLADAGGGTEMMRLNGLGLTVNGTFVSASDRNVKENFQTIDAQAVLEKVVALPLSEWNYKADTSSRHIGPMAQDFHAAFGVGPDDKHIATVDADGVALAAIQGLNQKVEEKEARIQSLEKELAALKDLVTHLANRRE